jgi:hypothetical protein
VVLGGKAAEMKISFSTVLRKAPRVNHEMNLDEI